MMHHPIKRDDLDGYILTLRLFQASAFATFVLLGAYVLHAFSRAFFHEGTKLRERRHALRFGRLYMYLKKDSFNVKEFEQVFDWNRDTATAFQQIKDISTETLQGKLLAMPADVIRAFLEKGQSKVGIATTTPSNDQSNTVKKP